MPKLSEVFILILIACFVSMVLELNKFGAHLEKNIKRPTVIYISSALTSAVCGILTALTIILFNNNIIVWIIFDIIGTFLGLKSLPMVMKLLSANLEFLKSSNMLGESLKQLDSSEGGLNVTKEKKSTTKKKP